MSARRVAVTLAALILVAPMTARAAEQAVADPCAACHLSATPRLPLSHDVGGRIAWTLRPPVSDHKPSWEARRNAMRQVCSACHERGFVDG